MAQKTTLEPGRELQRDACLQTKQVTPELIAYITEKITLGLAPRRIILFGSHARSEATGVSDLDLFIYISL